MGVAKRKTSRGETAEYHYKFMQGGKCFYGVCEGCTTKAAALAYEKTIKEKAKAASGQKNVRALIENFRDELTGGDTITFADAFDRYLTKPRKRIPSEHQTKVNRGYWADFVAFMAARYPETVNIADVTDRQSGEYITMLRDSGAFIKDISFTRQQGRKTIKATYKGGPEKLSHRTINARHKAIKAVFAWLAADAGLLKNPFDIPTLANETISRDAFSDAELQKIGANMTMPYIRPIFTIGLCTGLTLGDICLLRWDEINNGWIDNKRRRKTGVMLDIPIMPPLAAFLEEQHPKTGESEFVSPELAKMYKNNYSGLMIRVKQFLEGLGIQTAVKVEGRSRAVSTKAAHAMRHTFAYLAGVYNIPQPIVQSVLGHMSPEMTALYQRHSTREAKAKFLQQMPNVLGAPTGAPVQMLPAPAAIDREPERAELHRLADTLTIEQINIVLEYISNEVKK